jgi:hypothetical protein
LNVHHVKSILLPQRKKKVLFLAGSCDCCHWVSIQQYENYSTPSVVKWSGFLATNPEVRVRFPALPDSLRNSGSGTGLVSTIKELLGRKISGCGLENRD